MAKDDPERFATIIAALAASYRIEATEAMFAGYQMALDDLPIGDIERAAKRALRECKFMPSGAELRELAGQLRPEQRAAIAWSILRKASCDSGYSTVVFDDPVLTATVRALGGWPEVCDYFCDEPEAWLEGVFRRRFEDTYTSVFARGISDPQAAPLSGRHERHNRCHGFLDWVPKPKQIACGLPALPADRIRRLARMEPEALAQIALAEDAGKERRTDGTAGT